MQSMYLKARLEIALIIIYKSNYDGMPMWQSGSHKNLPCVFSIMYKCKDFVILKIHFVSKYALLNIINKT